VAFKEDLSKSAEALQKMQSSLDKTVKSIQDSVAKATADAKVAREKATQALSKIPSTKKTKRGNDDDDP
jgi:DNA anti-recombination protein RmuC